MTEKILICDANHGGLALVKEYSKYTSNHLFFYDTYNKLTGIQKQHLSKMYPIVFLSLDEILENKDKYVKVCPVHMDAPFGRDYTHHEFAGYLINKHKAKYHWNFKIIEVTGVKGKTTTTNMIKGVLKDKNVLVLTSNDLSYNSKGKQEVLYTFLSIAPASMITALNIALGKGLLDTLDYFLCEVSLGITPNADIGVLTNILEDYSIKNNKSCASIAKKSVFMANTVICDKFAFDKYYGDIKQDNIITVGLDGGGSNISAGNINYGIGQTTFVCNCNGGRYKFSCFALSDFYVNNILFAIAVGLVTNMDVHAIISNIHNLKPMEGRTSIKHKDNKIIFEDINSGLNTSSIKKCIQNINKFSDNHIIIIGGDYGITCEEIDEDKLIKYLKQLKNPFILTGKVGYSLSKNLNGIKYFESLKNAYDYCLSTDYGIIQIIYRSEYDKHLSQ